MKTTLLILTLAACTSSGALLAADSKPINPALLYWLAAAELPQLTSDQAKAVGDIAAGRRPFDVSTAKSLPDYSSALRFVHKAADSTAPCDWGLPVEEGPFLPLPHLSKMQQMGSLAIVQAETLFADGKVKDGLDWLLAAHHMARHAGATDILISNLVQFAIETNALRAAARHCLAWDEDTRRSYAASLKALPALHSTQAAYTGENLFIDGLEDQFAGSGHSKEEVMDLFKSIDSGTDKPETKESIQAQFAPGAIHEAVAEMRKLHSRAETALGKPWPQCQAELKALDDEAEHSAQYLVRSSFPVINTVAQKQFAVATVRTMLEAALEYGPRLNESAAANYHDAFEEEPLGLKRNDDGTLTLLAAHQHPTGKDVSLQVGK